MGPYLKGVAASFGTMMLFWMSFEWSIGMFGLLSLGCLLVPLVYYMLAAKFSRPQTEQERRKQLRLELLKGVAYKPAKPRMIGDPASNPIRHSRQKK